MAGWRGGVVAVVLAGGLVAAAPAAADSAAGLCIPTAGGAAVTTPASGSTCAAGSSYKQLAAQSDLTAAEARITALENLLAGVTRATVNGHMTLRISSENLQL